jgi:PAS domain S-box-containing protein
MAQSQHKPFAEYLQLLLVDANPAYFELTQKLLRFHHAGYAVDFASDAAECLQKVSEKTYDLILLTNDLPGISGLGLLDTLRDRGISQPAVLMLEEGQEELALRALEAGALDYVIKSRGYLTALPYTIQKVIERVRLLKQAEESARWQQGGGARRRRGTFLLDRRGRFLSASPDVEALTAYTEDELLELTLTDLMPREREWEFFKWLRLVDEHGTAAAFPVTLAGKYGQAQHVHLHLAPQKDARREITGYRGELREQVASPSKALARNGKIDQVELLDELLAATSSSFNEPLSALLSRVAEISCRRFHFKRATMAMLDPQRRVFVNHLMAGFPSASATPAHKPPIEVPQEVISRIFGDRFKIKVVYSSQAQRDGDDHSVPVIPERRTQKRRAASRWHPRDLVLVNLSDARNRSFGYISLEEPQPGHVPVRDTFHNLELFGRLTSQFIQAHYHYAALERRTRRLKQMLVTNNIFKLQLSLSELLREVVWSVKFSLDFNVVMLGLLSRRSGMLEMRAVAADDKLNAMNILGVKIPQDECASLLKKEYLISRSYFIDREEPVLRPLKLLYHHERHPQRTADDWPPYGMLMVPIKSALGKIIGFLMLDNPADLARPAVETVRLLELLANQISVAMDNRVLYVEAKNRATAQSRRDGTANGRAAAPRRVRKLFSKLLG